MNGWLYTFSYTGLLLTSTSETKAARGRISERRASGEEKNRRIVQLEAFASCRRLIFCFTYIDTYNIPSP